MRRLCVEVRVGLETRQLCRGESRFGDETVV